MQYPEAVLRDEDLTRLMTIYLDEKIEFVRNNPRRNMARHILDTDAPRFYISESRARKIVYAFRKGKTLSNGHRPQQAALHADFYKVFCDLEKENKNRPYKERKTTSQLILDAIYSPAPSFYANIHMSAIQLDQIIRNKY